MADALVSPPVAAVAGAAAAVLIGVAARRVGRSTREDIVPLMGVMGAFIFAAQMINFTIPGTGSSGHVIGGVLLAAILGPWAAFLTLCSVIIIQCLIFADGGLLALGCNILNMGVTSCLIAYPLVYKPVAGRSLSPWRLFAAAILASVVALEIGALGVTAQTELSGVTALPTGKFLLFMLPIHLLIGIGEGLATGAVLWFVSRYRPSVLASQSAIAPTPAAHNSRLATAFAVAALVLAGSFTWIASSNPDGLEWSISKVSALEPESAELPTAIMPDYDSTFAGIVGAVIVMVALYAVTTVVFRKKKDAPRE